MYHCTPCLLLDQGSCRCHLKESRQLVGKAKGQPEDLISFDGNNMALACPM